LTAGPAAAAGVTEGDLKKIADKIKPKSYKDM
jgi:hypothetical protein